MIPAPRLRRIRNEIPITVVLEDLGIPHRFREGFVRFLCPRCGNENTAVNPRTNLARCFGCRRNYNTIDLVMIVDRARFLDAVHSLEPFLEE